MASSSESESLMETSSDDFREDENEESDSEEGGVVISGFRPYQDEPLAPAGEIDEVESDEETDEDGLTAAILAARENKEVAVSDWLVLVQLIHGKLNQ